MLYDINKMSSGSKLFFGIVMIFLCTLFQLVLMVSVSLEIISYLQLSLSQFVILAGCFILSKQGNRFFTKKTWSYIARIYIIVFVILFSVNIFIGFINPIVCASDSIFPIENLLNEDEVFNNYTEINDSRSELFKETTYSLQNADVKVENSNKEYELELSTNIHFFRMPFLSNVYMKTIVSSKGINDFNLNDIITEQKGDSYFCYFKRENIVYMIECNEKWLLERIIKQASG